MPAFFCFVLASNVCFPAVEGLQFPIRERRGHLAGPSRPADRETPGDPRELKILFQLTGGILDDQLAIALAYQFAEHDDRAEADRVNRPNPGQVEDNRFHVMLQIFPNLPVHGLGLFGHEIPAGRDVDDFISLVAANQHRRMTSCVRGFLVGAIPGSTDDQDRQIMCHTHNYLKYIGKFKNRVAFVSQNCKQSRQLEPDSRGESHTSICNH